VVTYDDATVMAAVDELKVQKLARSVLPSHGRSVVRFRHVLDEALGLDAPECALLAVLMLRGPQTVGELRLRTDRMAEFDSLDQLEAELIRLAGREDPLVRNIGRRPGQKEERWACTLMALATGAAPPTETDWRDDIPADNETSRDNGAGAPSVSPLDALRSDVATLAAEVAELRAGLAELRSSLGE
jgi:uncharacterized protein YceH (UPF0502 family)